MRSTHSTSFKLRGKDFHVDLLTPLQGPDTYEPVQLPHFNSYAHPVRFLECLLEDRPGDVWVALDAVRAMPEKFQSDLAKGIEQLPISAKEAVKNHFRRS